MPLGPRTTSCGAGTLCIQRIACAAFAARVSTETMSQINVLHDYIGHPSTVIEEVVDLRNPRRACNRIALGEVFQRHDLGGVEGRVIAELDKILPEYEAVSVFAVILIFALAQALMMAGLRAAKFTQSSRKDIHLGWGWMEPSAGKQGGLPLFKFYFLSKH